MKTLTLVQLHNASTLKTTFRSGEYVFNV